MSPNWPQKMFSKFFLFFVASSRKNMVCVPSESEYSSADEYRKDLCISRTFMSKFWAKNRGYGVYTRPLLSEAVNRLVRVTHSLKTFSWKLLLITACVWSGGSYSSRLFASSGSKPQVVPSSVSLVFFWKAVLQLAGNLHFSAQLFTMLSVTDHFDSDFFH